jgi:hypothetical protein
VRSKTPAAPDAKLTPFRDREELPGVLRIERYVEGVATSRLLAARMVVHAKTSEKFNFFSEYL